MRPYYVPESGEHTFQPGTRFEDILVLYTFDRELRLLLLDAIERIEVALRAQLTNTLAEHHGPHGHRDPALFHQRYNHEWLCKRLTEAADGRETEAFLRHYRENYPAAHEEPPIWMAAEILTFKEVSILFANLRQPADKQRLEAHFQWRYPVLKSWFHSLSDLRNVCAHHGRVWNREFGVRPILPRRLDRPWPTIPETIPSGSLTHPEQRIVPQGRLYMHLVVIESLMQVVSPASQWAKRLEGLLDDNPRASRPHMGIPEDWRQDPFWVRALAD